MAYFRTLPNILYQSPLPEKISTSEYIAVKNIFRRIKLNANISGSTTIFKFRIIATKPSRWILYWGPLGVVCKIC